MFSTKSAKIAAVFLIACSGKIQASELNYNYLELSASSSDDPGFWYKNTQKNSLLSSFTFGNRFYGIASFSRTQFELVAPVLCPAMIGAVCPDDSTVDEYSAGLGLRQSIGDKADIFVDANLTRIEINKDFYNDESDCGYTLRTGIRATLTEKVEGSITLSQRELDVLPDDFTISLATQFNINDTWALIGRIEDIGGRSDLGFGIRASFE